MLIGRIHRCVVQKNVQACVHTCAETCVYGHVCQTFGATVDWIGISATVNSSAVVTTIAAARIEEALQAIDYWPSISVDVPTNKLRRNMRKDI